MTATCKIKTVDYRPRDSSRQWRAHRDKKLSNVLADLRPVEAGAGLVQLGRENVSPLLLQLPGLVSEFAAFHAQQIFQASFRALVQFQGLPITRGCPQDERSNFTPQLIAGIRSAHGSADEETIGVEFGLVDGSLRFHDGLACTLDCFERCQAFRADRFAAQSVQSREVINVGIGHWGPSIGADFSPIVPLTPTRSVRWRTLWHVKPAADYAAEPADANLGAPPVSARSPPRSRP